MADASAPREGGDLRLAAFADPLAGWRNDDILLDKDARQALGAVQPQLLRVLDWPELRALFKQHEGPANQLADHGGPCLPRPPRLHRRPRAGVVHLRSGRS